MGRMRGTFTFSGGDPIKTHILPKATINNQTLFAAKIVAKFIRLTQEKLAVLENASGGCH